MGTIPRPGDTKFEVLTTIVDHWDTGGKGPSVEEIRAACGLRSRSSVQFHINSLLDEGFIQTIPKRARAVRATNLGKRLVQLMRDEHGATQSQG